MTDSATAADLMFRPAHELAGLVRAGQISARELVEGSLRRIDELNPTYNAFIDVFHDDALAAADAVAAGDDRPLAGVPIAIKNNRPLEGKRMTFASSLMGCDTIQGFLLGEPAPAGEIARLHARCAVEASDAERHSA